MVKKKASTRTAARKSARRKPNPVAAKQKAEDASDNVITAELWRLHDSIQKLITLSDRKCSIVISVALAFGAVAADTVGGHGGFRKWFQTDCCEPFVVLLALSMLALAVLLAGFAIWPRGSEDQSASLFSWCRITTLKDGDLATQVEELLKGKTMVRELSRQVEDLSRICTRKFEITRSSMGAAFVGILLMALHRIV